MTTTDKTILGALIVVACAVGIYEYWQVLEPIRQIVAVLSK